MRFKLPKNKTCLPPRYVVEVDNTVLSRGVSLMKQGLQLLRLRIGSGS